MATKYDPEEILEVLKISCWKSQTTLDHAGFHTLSDKINACDNSSAIDVPEIKQKYLHELFQNASQAVEDGKDLGRNEGYINAILGYLGFPNWDAFSNAKKEIIEQLHEKKSEIRDASKNQIVVLCPKQLESSVQDEVLFTQKNTATSLSFHLIDESEARPFSPELQQLSEQAKLMLFCIPHTWNTQAYFEKAQKAVSDLTPSQVIPINAENAGLSKLLLTIAIVESILNPPLNSPSKQSSSNLSDSSFTVKTNKGVVNQVKTQNLKGTNVTIGGDFIQKIYKNKK